MPTKQSMILDTVTPVTTIVVEVYMSQINAILTQTQNIGHLILLVDWRTNFVVTLFTGLSVRQCGGNICTALVHF